MATLSQLLPYLKRGFTLESANHETLTPTVSPLDRHLIITWSRPETKERYFWPQDYTLREISLRGSIWEHGVVFMDENKKPVVINKLEDIERAIEDKKPHTTWGKEPKEG